MAYETLENLEIFQSASPKLAESSVPYEIDKYVGEFVDEDDWFEDFDIQSPNHQSPNPLF
jgi:hypothetical protein